MGERAKLKGPFGGQFSLNDFLGQSNNRATPQDIVRTILPVQEMREFQRRYVFSAGKQTLQIGERLVLRWTVPRTEWWRPHNLVFTNKDTGTQTIRITFTVDNTGDNIYRAVQTVVPNGATQVVYGADLDGSIGDTAGRFASKLASIMEPGDAMAMEMTADVAVLAEMSWTLLYELVPQPATSLRRGPDAAVTVS